MVLLGMLISLVSIGNVLILYDLLMLYIGIYYVFIEWLYNFWFYICVLIYFIL